LKEIVYFTVWSKNVQVYFEKIRNILADFAWRFLYPVHAAALYAYGFRAIKNQYAEYERWHGVGRIQADPVQNVRA
jgi:hypothetical protein